MYHIVSHFEMCPWIEKGQYVNFWFKVLRRHWLSAITYLYAFNWTLNIAYALNRNRDRQDKYSSAHIVTMSVAVIRTIELWLYAHNTLTQ